MSLDCLSPTVICAKKRLKASSTCLLAAKQQEALGGWIIKKFNRKTVPWQGAIQGFKLWNSTPIKPVWLRRCWWPCFQVICWKLWIILNLVAHDRFEVVSARKVKGERSSGAPPMMSSLKTSGMSKKGILLKCGSELGSRAVQTAYQKITEMKFIL